MPHGTAKPNANPVPMSSHIIDAGPALNFLATNNQRILIAGIGTQPFHAPEAVRDEVMYKAAERPDLAAAAPAWRKIEANWIVLIPAARTSTLDRLATILTQRPLPKVPSRAKDSGETYVVIHAVERAVNGDKVIVIIDDGGGQELLRGAQQYLNAQRRNVPNIGTVTLMTTEDILLTQVNTKHIPDKQKMRRIYNQLRAVNAGLVHVDATTLLTTTRWSQVPQP